MMNATGMANRRSTLLALNDPRLEAYLTAGDDEARARELERILTGGVQPRVRAVLGAYVMSDWPIEADDADDIVGQVTLRVLRKLRAATVLEDESVQSLDAYVTTLTKNAVRDFLRRLSPERTRLRSRLRYLFLHDSRLALWSAEGTTLCGLAGWRDRCDQEGSAALVHRAVRAAGDFLDAPAEVVTKAVTALGKPVRLAHLVSALLEDGGAGARPRPVESASPPVQRDALEARQYLQVLWRQIRELPPNQRAALLLNLREPGSGNAVMLFVAMGIATLDEIAATVGMSRAQLSAIWNELPFDDLRIAAHLGMRRQQVINLRKSARERLARRMRIP